MNKLAIDNKMLKSFLLLTICVVGMCMAGASHLSAQTEFQTIPTDTLAAQSNSVDKSALIYTPSLAVGSMIRMFAALIAVILCIYVAVFLLKKFLGKRLPGNKSMGSLRILETKYLGSKQSLSLVQVGGRAVLVGVTEHGMTALTELSETETKDLLTLESKTVESEPFSQLLKSASTKIRELGAKRVIASSEVR
ncbi:MAG: flagellar biosynthetic protein FliO [candidate division Zixibacteria bacterium]|nr:flagellar biosynthetic protein FliO [candidate division Zixibacteria bacterium]